MQSQDETDSHLKHMDTLNASIELVFQEVLNPAKSPRQLQKELLDFFCNLGPRGFLTCLGLRKTVGSTAEELPPDRKSLIEEFN